MRKNKIRLSHISFEVSTRCNLQCRYCYNIWKVPGAFQPEDVTYRQARKTIKQLFRRADIDHFTFTGGEPMLFDRLAELVMLVRLKGCSVTLITNGNAGSEKDFRLLLRLGVGLFELPYHSIDPAIHDEMAGVAGAQVQSASRIKLLQELGARVVAVIVLTKHNLSTLQETLLKLKDMKVSSVMLNRFNIGGEGIRWADDLMPASGEFRAAFALADKMAAEYDIALTSNVCTPVCLLDPADYPNIGFGHCSSSPFQKPLTLDHTGNLRLCNHSPVIAGNIFDQTIGEIFSSEYVLSWNGHKPEFCSDCQKYEQCFAGCRAAAEQVGKTVGNEDPVLVMLGIKP